MTQFSKEFVQKTTDYFAEHYDHYITEEAAKEYLESTAGLYFAMSSVAKPL